MTYHHLAPYADSDHYAGVAVFIEPQAAPIGLPEMVPCPTQDELG